MDTVRHVFTESALSGDALFAVTADGVALVHRGATTILPFEEIASVALAYAPSRVDLTRYTCTITGRRGHSIRVQSSTYRGLASFEPQPDSYRKVVLALHRALVATAATSSVGLVRFDSGVSTARYALNLGCLLVTLPMLFGVLALFGSAIGIPAVLHLLVIASLLPFAWKWLRRNRPGSYDPSAIPAALLPDASTAPADSAPVPSPTAAAGPWVLPVGTRRYTLEDFGPIAEPGDDSWYGVAATHTHWADAEEYARAANEKLDKNLIGPPRDPPPQGEQPLR